MNINLKESLEEVIKEYSSIGGVVRVSDGKIVYPTKERLVSQLETVEKKLSELRSQLRELKKKQKEYSYDSVLSKLSRGINPLYWKHLISLFTDEEYRSAFEKIRPPVERFNDPRWGSMVKMFIISKEYRERLLEAKESPIGKNRPTIKENVMKSLEYGWELINQRIAKVEKEMNELEKKRKVLKKLLAFV